jgi:Xaa-Pro aminopeptidase
MENSLQSKKLIYDLVYEAQEAGIAAAKIGNNFNALML